MIPDILHNLRTGVKHATDLHQKEAYMHLVQNPRAALFLGMSLSKTVIALSYLHDMHYVEAAIGKTLVIAPDKVARITWPDEIRTWAHLQDIRYSLITGTPAKRQKALNTEAELYIIGVDSLSWLIDQYIKPKGSSWKGSLPFDCIVIDELSLFKGRDSKRFKKLRRALRYSNVPYRVGMTGTPTPNGYIDLWAQMHLLDDGYRLGDTFGKYLDKYFTTRGNGMIVYEYIPRPGAVKSIARKIKDIALTMLTRDKVKLPELHIVDHAIELTPYDKETYEILEKEYVLEFVEQEEITVKSPADLVNKLLQISSGAVYTENGDWFEVNTAKLDAMHQLLDEYPDDNFICVYQYRHEIERIKARFPFARELSGGKDMEKDFKLWNKGGIRLLLLHPKGAGHGLNLQFGGNRMIWFTLTWSLEYYQQTIARLLRRGAEKDIFVHRLIVRDTRDVKVSRKLERKDTDQTFLLNEIKQLRNKYNIFG